MKITVAIVTTGRPATLEEAVRDLKRQTRSPDRIIVSAASANDVGRTRASGMHPPIDILIGPKGLTVQRNAVLDALEDEDVILFLDDDFIMAPDFLDKLDAAFQQNSDIAVMTGNVIADGIKNAGLAPKEARRLLARAALKAPDPDIVDVHNGYGCNMAFRCAPIRENNLRFDERLPLYGWLEDVDFSRQVAAYGRCVKAMALIGVHLGTKGGRTSGRKLGYSQVANPLYLIGRKSMRPSHALGMISRNVAANLAKSFWPEPWVDRRGRLLGNLRAFGDLIRGRLRPEGVFNMDTGSNGTP
ncbi:glycosyltransferase [Yoonia sp. BS5-3]|uniref:Glycosyltransferase family 2 protein n=1 Tax=Yoonia phaeophyticola TaxID=3137369 RepID=A0ABZ2V7R5_9RHOB